MNNSKSLKPADRVKSVQYAIEGILQLMKEPNAKIHLVATIVVIIAGIVQHISVNEWICIVFAIGIVWITEAINTAIEKVCDIVVDGKWHPVVKIAKDIAAGAVLIASVLSIIIGLLIFLF